ncbi:MAG: hypothetical protein U9P79_05985 [Candidatus Cloacimonadota bacterium]|nr:hypothetical protein [Candidatus Cloacimonadota bacterium]
MIEKLFLKGWIMSFLRILFLIELGLDGMIFGLFVVPVVAILVTVTSGGRMGMYQHMQSHNITCDVFLSMFWAILVTASCIVVPLVVPFDLSFHIGIALSGLFSISPMISAALATWKETAMHLSHPIENGSFWSKLPFHRIPIRFNLSNCLSVFSILLEYVQMLCLAYTASRPSLAVSVDTSFIGSLTQFTLHPLGASLLVQWIVGLVFAAILVGFITVSIVLTSQPESPVARVSEQKEREGNLSWFKLLVAFLADTMFLSVTSTIASFLSASIASSIGDLDGSSNMSSVDMSDNQFRALSVLSLVQLFAFVCCAMMIILPIQAVFPDIWLPNGIDLRASPQFSMIEKTLKMLIVGILSLGPASNVIVRSSLTTVLLFLLFSFVLILRRSMTHAFSAAFHRVYWPVCCLEHTPLPACAPLGPSLFGRDGDSRGDMLEKVVDWEKNWINWGER